MILKCHAYGFATIPPQKQGSVTTAITPASQETENLSQHYLALSEKSLEYEPKLIIWPALIIKGLVVEPYSDFAQANNVYLVGFSETSNEAVISPTGDIGYHTMDYHFIAIPRQIGQRDIRGLFFPEIQDIDTEFGTVGIVDCIESGSTLPTKDVVNNGVQFLVVLTGSPNAYVFSWALGTNAIYRAAEHHIFVASVIGDYAGSMLIDPYGRIIDDIAPESEIVAGKIAFTDERTFYSKYGDIFGWAIAGLFILLIGYNQYLKRRSPFTYCFKEECRAEIPKGTKTCDKCGATQKKRSLWQRISWFIIKP